MYRVFFKHPEPDEMPTLGAAILCRDCVRNEGDNLLASALLAPIEREAIERKRPGGLRCHVCQRDNVNQD